MTDEYEFFVNKRSDRTYISKAFPDVNAFDEDDQRLLRIISKVFDSDASYEFAKIKAEIILRQTFAGRQEIKAIFYEDSRHVKNLTFQRFTVNTGSPHRTAFTLGGSEVEKLYNFLRFIKYVELNSLDKQRLDDNILNEWLLSVDEKRSYFSQHLDLVEEIAANNITRADIVALAYRKQQLEIFEHLLNDKQYFENKMREWKLRGPEAVWQRFFENNSWIFGYGLQYIFTSQLDNQKLEQVTSGYNFQQSGKRVDALVKTRGYISTLCFIEIKTHETPLLYAGRPYRSECWRVSDDLAGSVAQIQKTVQKAIKDLQTKLELGGNDGMPTGEVVFMYQPKAYVVIGCLSEFTNINHINEQKFSSFELFRRNIMNPEIITFDELFQRAKYIIEHSESGKHGVGVQTDTPDTAEIADEDLPF